MIQTPNSSGTLQDARKHKNANKRNTKMNRTLLRVALSSRGMNSQELFIHLTSALWAAFCAIGCVYLIAIKRKAGEALNFRIVDIYTVALISLPWLVQAGHILSRPDSDENPHEDAVLLGLLLLSQVLGVIFEWALRKPEECKVRSHLWHALTTFRGGVLGLFALAAYWFLAAILYSLF